MSRATSETGRPWTTSAASGAGRPQPRRLRRHEVADRAAPHDVQLLRIVEDERELPLRARRHVERARRARVQEEKRRAPDRQDGLAVDDLPDLADDAAHRADPRVRARVERAGDRRVDVDAACTCRCGRSPRPSAARSASRQRRSSTDRRGRRTSRRSRPRPGRRAESSIVLAGSASAARRTDPGTSLMGEKIARVPHLPASAGDAWSTSARARSPSESRRRARAAC